MIVRISEDAGGFKEEITRDMEEFAARERIRKRDHLLVKRTINHLTNENSPFYLVP